MSLVVAWLLFPLVLGLLSLGCGLLVERAAGCPVQRELYCLWASRPSWSSRSARRPLPRLRGSRRPSWWLPRSLASARAARAAQAGRRLAGRPQRRLRRVRGARFLSGTATFAGYIKLDDTATWLAFTDRLLDHGRNVSGTRSLHVRGDRSLYLAGGYPVGAFPPLGVVHELLGTDSAWLFQPYVAFLGSHAGARRYGLTCPSDRFALPSRYRRLRRRAACAALRLFALGRCEGGRVGRPPRSRRRAHPGRAAAGRPTAERSAVPWRPPSLLGVLSFFGALWVVPILLPALLVGIYRRGRAFSAHTGCCGRRGRPRSAHLPARRRILRPNAGRR